jgi:hypothetical protein
MRGELRTGYRNWREMRDHAHTLADAYKASECARERGIDKYNILYAELLIERGAVSLMAERNSRGAAADSSGALNGSAAVLEFPKGA